MQEQDTHGEHGHADTGPRGVPILPAIGIISPVYLKDLP
jgi:hypothetical protein